MGKLKRIMKGEEGMGTVEIVIIVAVLVGIALIFRDQILAFAGTVMDSVFADPNISNDLNPSVIRGGP